MIKTYLLPFLITVLTSCTSCHSTPPERLLSNHSYVQTQQEALESSVLVEFGFATGSGFVVNTFLNENSTQRCYRIITAAHVINSKHIDARFPYPFVRFTLENDTKTFKADVTYRDDFNDTALLTVWTYETEQLCLPFRVVDNDVYLEYARKVYLVSFPQGFGPMLTEGIISSIHVLDFDKEAYTTTAQSMPGSSGGAIIDAMTGEVLGLLKAVMVQPGSPHMFGWVSIVAPAHELRPLALWKDDEPLIIPAGPRGDMSTAPIIIFTPTDK